MSKPFVSYQRATSLSAGLFLLSLAVIAYYDAWWPQIMLALGGSLAVRHILIKKYWDAFLAAFIFSAIFVTVHFNLSWLPAIFIVAGLFVLFRATQSRPESVIEEDEETEKEIEEEESKNK